MPKYPWLIKNKLDSDNIEGKMNTLVKLGVPYTEEDIANARASMDAQASKIQESLYSDPDFVKTYEADKKMAEEQGIDFVEMKDREIVAMIAYLQRLGTDIQNKDADNTASN
jgi:cytochrome c oxidase cbb3-type subunit I/II